LIAPFPSNGPTPSFSAIEISRIAPVGADLAAEGAVQLAPAHLRDHDRRPEPLDSRLEEARLQDVGRADADALVALDAAAEEFVLLDRAGGADDRPVEVLLDPAREPRHGEEEQAEDPGQDELPAADGRRGDLARLAGEEPERERIVRAVVDAVHADEALALAEVGVRVGGPLAALDAEVAVGAADRVAVDPPEREPAEDPQSAPSGQIARQKKRGIHQLATRNPMKIRPTTQACQYSRGSV
jgi:hypothetical protein